MILEVSSNLNDSKRGRVAAVLRREQKALQWEGEGADAAWGYPSLGAEGALGGLWRAGGIHGCRGARVKAAVGPGGNVGCRDWGKPSMAVLSPGQLDPSRALADALQPERDEPLCFAASIASLSHGAGGIVPAAQGVRGNSFDLCPRALFGTS